MIPDLEFVLRAIEQLPGISLSELNARAALQTRVDRKYILDRDSLLMLLGASHQLAALEMEGARAFEYASIYFDTEELTSYRAAALRRRRRFKVRTRSYVDSKTCFLEVKTRGRRGTTVKHRQPHRYQDRHMLAGDERRFIDGLIAGGSAQRLQPILETTYWRVTLVGVDDDFRITIDCGLRCTLDDGSNTALDGWFIVETKSATGSSTVDRQLWSQGARPQKISKYATSLAVLRPDLPSNKWHRTINRYFDAHTS